MADVREYVQIIPIDEETNRAIGVRFPFNAEGVFHSTYTTKEQVKSNLLNVLLTEPGERVFNPNFGVGLRHQLFENNINKDELISRIEDQTARYIPEIEVTNVTVKKSKDSHELFIAIYYRVLVNNEEDAIQVNFAQDENLGGSDMSSPSIGAY
tara:strand:- start:1145 stop:1606 length:462 start_codon:yes stop_codon:yes gene_type:complete